MYIALIYRLTVPFDNLAWRLPPAGSRSGSGRIDPLLKGISASKSSVHVERELDIPKDERANESRPGNAPVRIQTTEASNRPRRNISMLASRSTVSAGWSVIFREFRDSSFRRGESDVSRPGHGAAMACARFAFQTAKNEEGRVNRALSLV